MSRAMRAHPSVDVKKLAMLAFSWTFKFWSRLLGLLKVPEGVLHSCSISLIQGTLDMEELLDLKYVLAEVCGHGLSNIPGWPTGSS